MESYVILSYLSFLLWFILFCLFYVRLSCTRNRGITFLQNKKKSWSFKQCLTMLFVLNPLIFKIVSEWLNIISGITSMWIIYDFRSWYVLKYFLLLLRMKLILIFEFCMRWLSLNYIIVYFQYIFKNYWETA